MVRIFLVTATINGLFGAF